MPVEQGDHDEGPNFCVDVSERPLRDTTAEVFGSVTFTDVFFVERGTNYHAKLEIFFRETPFMLIGPCWVSLCR